MIPSPVNWVEPNYYDFFHRISISVERAYYPEEYIWWRFTDSNRGPVDYDSIALTD